MPSQAYLATSISPIKGYASAFPIFRKNADGSTPDIDFSRLSAEEMDALLDYSFERYFEESGLFGTVEGCTQAVDRLKGIGVDDVACLVDSGVERDLALKHLRHLNQLRARTSRPRAAFADDNFFAIGGRSPPAVQVHSRLNAAPDARALDHGPLSIPDDPEAGCLPRRRRRDRGVKE